MIFNRPLSQTNLINDANLVAYWTLDGNGNDSKGSNNGTSTNVTYSGIYSQFGQGGNFNGSTSNISIPDSVQLKPSGAYTISHWIKCTSIGSTNYTIFSSFNTTPSGQGILTGIQGTTGYFFLDSYTSGVERYILDNINVCDGNWHHLVGVYDGTGATGAKIYVDGILKKTSTSWTTQTYNTSTNKVRIGCYINNSSITSVLNGNIDDVVLFNRALSDSEVFNLYAGESYTYNRSLYDTRISGDTGLVGYWKLDGNSNDSKGTNHGTDTSVTYGTQYGLFNQGAYFNGSSKIATTSSWFPSSAFTVTMWVKTNDTSMKGIWGLGGISWGAYITLSQTQLLFNVATTSPVAEYSQTINLTNLTYANSWIFIAVQKDGTNLNVYVNGVLVGARTSNTSSIRISDNYIWIGAHNRDNTASYMNGTIDDVAIFNRALGATEIQEIYEIERIRSIYRPLSQSRFINDENLVSYWNFDGTGNDIKGSNNLTNTSVTYINNVPGYYDCGYGCQFYSNNPGCTSCGSDNSSLNLFKQAAFYNGSSSISRTSIVNKLSRDTTFSCWAKINIKPVGSGMLMTSIVSSYSNYWKSLYFVNSSGTINLVFAKYNGTQNPTVTSTGLYSFSLGVWYHVVGVQRGTTLELYVNGNFISSATDTTTTIPSYSGFTIGGQTTPANRYFNGVIDDASVFDRALSREEISEIYQSKVIGEYIPLVYKPQGGLYATSLINDASLVSYWRLDGNSRDSKGTNHGTDSSVTYSTAAGKFGQGGIFNGSSKITTPTISLSSPFTVSAWIKFTSTSLMFILGEAAPSGSFYSWFWIVNSGYLNFYSKGTDEQTGVATPMINDGNWHHVVSIYTPNSNIIGYCDGIYLGSTPITTTFTYRAFTIGYGDDSYWGGFSGNLDDISIFNRSLSSSEVYELYIKGLSSQLRPLENIKSLYNDNNLYAYWKLNGNTNDSKGNANGTPTEIYYYSSVGGQFNVAAAMSSSSQITATISQITSAFSISFWLNPFYLTDYNQAITGGIGWGTFVFHTTSTGGIYVGTDVTNRLTISELPSGTLSIGSWHHFVFTFSGGASSGTGKFYKNGILMASRSGMLNPVSFTSLSIGAPVETSAIMGYIQDVALFTRELNGNEVYKIYTNGQTLGYWKLNGNSTDHSGNGNHGTDTSISYIENFGNFNKGALFNGSNSYIALGQTNMFNETFTLSAWFKTTSSGVILGIQNTTVGSGPNEFNPLIYIGSDYKLRGGVYNGLAAPPLYSTATYNDNKWHNVIIVGNKANGLQYLYIDGAFIMSGNRGSTALLYYNIGVGYTNSWANGNNGWYYFNGYIEEIIFESKIWSDTDVRKYFTNNKGRFYLI